jgi:phosphofructokinase-like protein
VERIGIVTGGGDCPGLNAVIRAVVKAASRRGWEVLGFQGGFEGLLDPPNFKVLDYRDMGALLYRGGTVLGTASRGRFSAKTGHGETRQLPRELLDGTRTAAERFGLRALVCIGGDGTLTIAQQLSEVGVPVVGIPKTIDNDLAATLTTFGFDSAVACATDALDRLHTTAESHERVMVLEVMGRYAGWIAASAGLAGGADVILIPEIPFDYDSVCDKVAGREAEGKHFTMIVAAEGARETGHDFTTAAPTRVQGEARLGGVGYTIADEIGRRTGKEARACVLGHLQRGGPPTPVDRQLCTRFGVAAVTMIAEGLTGYMASYLPPEVVPVPLRAAVGQIRTVPADGELVRTCRALGVSFGDERRLAAVSA